MGWCKAKPEAKSEREGFVKVPPAPWVKISEHWDVLLLERRRCSQGMGLEEGEGRVKEVVVIAPSIWDEGDGMGLDDGGGGGLGVSLVFEEEEDCLGRCVVVGMAVIVVVFLVELLVERRLFVVPVPMSSFSS